MNRLRWPHLFMVLAVLGLWTLQSGPAADSIRTPASRERERNDPLAEAVSVPREPGPAVQASDAPLGARLSGRAPVARLVLRFEGGIPFGCVVAIFDARRQRERDVLIEDRRLDLEGLTPGPKELVLHQPPFGVTREAFRLEPGATERTLAVPESVPAAALEGRLLDAGGFPLPELHVSIRVPATAPFDGWSSDEPVMLHESFVAFERLVGLSTSSQNCRLDADGWVVSSA